MRKDVTDRQTDRQTHTDRAVSKNVRGAARVRKNVRNFRVFRFLTIISVNLYIFKIGPKKIANRPKNGHKSTKSANNKYFVALFISNVPK